MDMLITTSGQNIEVKNKSFIDFQNLAEVDTKLNGYSVFCDERALIENKPYNERASRMTGAGLFGDVLIVRKF